MALLSLLTRLFILRRLFGDRRPARYGYGRRPYRRAYARRGGSGGFGMFGPFPYYSRRTSSGARVSVGGCCLPLALGLLAAPAALLRLILRG